MLNTPGYFQPTADANRGGTRSFRDDGRPLKGKRSEVVGGFLCHISMADPKLPT